MKTKTSKQPKDSKTTVQVNDIKPKKDVKAGRRNDPNQSILFVATGEG